ncbi:MAG: UDP-N-acetylglucosamine 2-epimerase (non-hydrolyzing) [Candidatus Aureabacteria bacterium]|nr:UDP-N-acetylglucosamine 2-epimerase (non-hydrolyzing) [Candidatus Auribacterota bacterium]
MKKRKKIRIVCAVGARPNFVKIAPILKAFQRYPQILATLVHTGQHYDRVMSDAFFRDLKIPRPAVELGIGSGSHAWQTGKIMAAFEEYLLKRRPDLVLVVGDVNSTLACALAAVKLHVPVAHVEAGLRSFNRMMPEEVNRLLTDQISDYLFITSPEAETNLRREGVKPEKIFFVGNVMIDSLKKSAVLAEKRSRVLQELKLKPRSYAVLTLHRPESTDDKEMLGKALEAVAAASALIPVVYPVHPRTAKRIEEFGLTERLLAAGIRTIPPLGYLDFLKLMTHARLVLTDSGGIQEETTVLKVLCLTLRNETERPVTVTEGTNVVVGLDRGKVARETAKILKWKGKKGRIPAFWDGRAAGRIARVILRRFARRRLTP